MLDKLYPIVQMLFQRVSIEHLLASDERGKLYYQRFRFDYLHDLMLTYYQQYSDTELRMQIREVQEQMHHYRQNPYQEHDVEFFNVFDILFYYAEEVLTYHENRVVCKYYELLRWNELVRVIGEDLLVVSYLAKSDIDCGRMSRNFCWAPVIGHNNGRLNQILKKGMAENHFHLRGSAPHFHITWANLMNHPARSEYLEFLDRLDENSRDKNKKSEVRIARRPLRDLVACAALIRFYLCSRFQGFQLSYEAEQESDEKKEKQMLTVPRLRRMLAEPLELELYVGELQVQIDSWLLHGQQDYMSLFVPSTYSYQEREYLMMEGERWFLYQMLRRIQISDRPFTGEEYNWFYAYLRIKNELRSELVQTNDLVGFENFQIYQKRKDWFTHTKRSWRQSEGMVSRLAVLDVLNHPAIQHLEVRISPGTTAEINLDNIYGYDEAITRAYSAEDELEECIQEAVSGNGRKENSRRDALLQRYYYVFQFTKQPEPVSGEFGPMECRHFAYRQQLLQKAKAIIRFREKYPEYAKRVLGIDACSQEIGCRPEVFGRIFRTLKRYITRYEVGNHEYFLPQLKLTYHVGEDFLDIVDGLRAVDEALRFLGLDCGDRIGHALVLGIDAVDWYRQKGYQVTLTLQDYLDNIAWLHHELVRFGISGMEALSKKLEEQFSYYFSYVYRQYMGQFQDMIHFDLMTYYLAWLLRGDMPSLYKTGSFVREEVSKADQWQRYAVNREHLRVQDIREIPEVTLLYHMYHYSREVRERGAQKRTVNISEQYIRGVVEVQKKMREELVERGIAVETNPSSNLRIGTFQKYSDHPIKVFYNLGLTKNETELMECPQMNVSINTDDKGVFSTRLENEYALLACAMEKEKNPDGSLKYKKEFIYEWLDNIREMGIQQTFWVEE